LYTGTVSSRVVLPAPAKINLHLAVGGRLHDGFHPIASIFQAISLFDTVTVELRVQGGIEIACDCDCVPEANTAYKAACLFLQRCQSAGLPSVPGVKITIDKRIPAGAGLGGGSSDAASTLRALAGLIPGHVAHEELNAMAAIVGSDVPFFMETVCARVTGRGETIDPIVPRTDYSIVLVNPGFPVATKTAYRRLDEGRVGGLLEPPHPIAEMEAELARVSAEFSGFSPENWNFRNDFYPAMAIEHPGLASCHDALRHAGAMFVSMTGSGSCVFGIFGNGDDASRAGKELAGDFESFITFPLARPTDSI
jgi:4-diphosphocytidyl-2-C-methyl-D-erythritol kinase